MIRAFLDYLRRFSAAIRHDDAISATTCDDERLATIANHCRYLLQTEAAAWIPTGKRREILADLHRVEVRDAYEQVDSGSYLEFVGGRKP